MGIKKRDVEYLIFEDKGVVVCKLWNCWDIARQRIKKYMPCTSVNLSLAFFDYTIDDVFVGVAKCAPDDEFDLEYGKKLALTRAKIKRGRAVNNAIAEYINDTQNGLARLNFMGIHKIPDIEDIEEVKKDEVM